MCVFHVFVGESERDVLILYHRDPLSSTCYFLSRYFNYKIHKIIIFLQILDASLLTVDDYTNDYSKLL